MSALRGDSYDCGLPVSFRYRGLARLGVREWHLGPHIDWHQIGLRLVLADDPPWLLQKRRRRELERQQAR